MSGPSGGYYYDRVDASHSASDSAALLCGNTAASVPPPYCAESTSRHYYETGGSACSSLISASRLAAFQQLMHNNGSASPMSAGGNGSATMGRLAFPPPPTAPPPPPGAAAQYGGSGYFRHHHNHPPPPPPPLLGSPRLGSSCASDAAKSSKALNNSCSAESISGDDSAVAYTTSALFSASGSGGGANACGGKSCRKRCKNGPLTLSRHRPKSLFSTLFLFLIIVFAFAAFYYALRRRTGDDEEYGDDFLYYKNANDGILYGNWTPGGGAPAGAMASMPTQFRVGQLVQADLPPRRIVYTKFSVAENAQLLLNVSVAASTKLVLYARQTLAPTPSAHDFQRIVDADHLYQNRQHSGPGRPEWRYTVIHHFTVAGVWYLGFLNDDQKPQPIVFSAALAAPSSAVSLTTDGSLSTDEASECRFNCFGKGACRAGVCHCYPGYSGTFCEETSCPALCNGNGVFSAGKCVCHAGFRGAECELSATWCSPADCNYRGRCSTQPDAANDANGGLACECEPGWTGPTCADPACQPSADCSGYGICQNGRCYCTSGRYGGACEKVVVEPQGSLCSSLTVSNSTTDEDDIATLPTSRNYDIGQDEDNSGDTVTITTTSPTKYGRSEAGRSRLLLPTPLSTALVPPTVRPTEEDLSGKCAPGCKLHGTCKRRNAHHRRHHSKVGAAALETESDEFVCECERGWNGENCFLEGCPRNCSGGSGVCAWRPDPASAFGSASASTLSSLWQCVCDSSHFGETCQYSQESTCDDGLDNDNDGLTDCEDSECCRAAACAANPLCLSVPIGNGSALGGTAAGSGGGSDFYARVRFLFTANAAPANSDSNAVVQRYADDTLFDKKRISVLRGRVLSSVGGPLTGVRVSDAASPQLGFTTTRSSGAVASDADDSGVFDLAVNGGTAVRLLLIRQPYGRVERSYFVGRNEILNVGDIFIDRPPETSSLTTNNYPPSCQQPQQQQKNNRRERLSLGAFPKIYTGSDKDADPAAASSSGLFSIFDRRSPARDRTSPQSRINLVLLDGKRPAPANLRRIRVEISVAGRLYRLLVAPSAGVRRTIEWDGRNVYGDREPTTVYAKVRVAYDFVAADEAAERHRSASRRGPSGDEPLLTEWQEECLRLDPPLAGDK